MGCFLSLMIVFSVACVAASPAQAATTAKKPAPTKPTPAPAKPALKVSGAVDCGAVTAKTSDAGATLILACFQAKQAGCVQAKMKGVDTTTEIVGKDASGACKIAFAYTGGEATNSIKQDLKSMTGKTVDDVSMTCLYNAADLKARAALDQKNVAAKRADLTNRYGNGTAMSNDDSKADMNLIVKSCKGSYADFTAQNLKYMQ